MSLRNPGARFVSGPSRCFRRRRRPAWKGLLVVVGVCAAAVCEARPPNVVLILADDVGYGDLGVYGHPYARTPSLDRLAREGTRFTHFYVGGFTCNPSRTAFMTGRYPARYENRTDNNGFGNWMTISEALANQGYSTAHFGKWHIGPMKRDGTYGIGEIRTPAGSRSDPEGRDAAIFAAAIEFIERHRDSPFYVNIWGRIAHSPINPPPRLYRRFPDFDFDRNDFGKWAQVNFDRSQSLIDRYGLSEDLATAMRKYESEIGALDSQVGGLLDRLAELGLSHNTIVIFTSDQGAEPVFRSESELTEDVERPNVRKNLLGYAGGLRGSKHTVYEGGVRAPLIVRWPKKIPAGVVNRTSVISATDLLPTLARIAGADIDAEHSAELDGEDISDIWFGSRRSRSQPIF